MVSVFKYYTEGHVNSVPIVLPTLSFLDNAGVKVIPHLPHLGDRWGIRKLELSKWSNAPPRGGAIGGKSPPKVSKPLNANI